MCSKNKIRDYTAKLVRDKTTDYMYAQKNVQNYLFKQINLFFCGKIWSLSVCTTESRRHKNPQRFLDYEQLGLGRVPG